MIMSDVDYFKCSNSDRLCVNWRLMTQMQGDSIAKITAVPEFAVALHELPSCAHLMWPMYWEVSVGNVLSFIAFVML